MSHIYDNWERLVAATIKRQQLWDLFHSHSRTPSLLSEATSSDLMSFDADSPSIIDVDVAAADSWIIPLHDLDEELADLREFLKGNYNTSVFLEIEDTSDDNKGIVLLESDHRTDEEAIAPPPIPEEYYYFNSSSLLDDYLAAVDEIIQLTDELNLHPADVKGRAEDKLQQAMTRLEAEFRFILTRNTIPLDPIRIHLLSNNDADDDGNESDLQVLRSSNGVDGKGLDELLLNSPDSVIDLREIANRMIRSGYDKECCRVYGSVRGTVLDECVREILGLDKLSISIDDGFDKGIDGFQILDGMMKKWIQAVKIVVGVLLSSEKRLCDQIFVAPDSMKESCLLEAAKGCLMHLLKFAEEVAARDKLSPEKLFRILDMYNALSEVLADLQSLFDHMDVGDDAGDHRVCSMAMGVLEGLGQLAIGTLVAFEDAVRTEPFKAPMHDGGIHPLSRYVMNYGMLVVDYRATLCKIFENHRHRHLEEVGRSKGGEIPFPPYYHERENSHNSLIAQRLTTVIEVLESKIEEKSRMYEDSAMRNIFLMNNTLYIMQKMRVSEELLKTVGGDWIKKRRSQLRVYSTHYLRASWSKALSCLKVHGGFSSNSRNFASLVKAKLKNFNACFEDNYRVQTAWKIPDPQLREELKIFIMETLIPAYRSFLGRFGGNFERRPERYVKYTWEDLESYSLDLFEGRPLLLHPKKQIMPMPRLSRIFSLFSQGQG